MPNQIEIVTAALVAIGDIGDLQQVDDETPRGAKAAAVYPIARDALLVSHWWSFAMARAELRADRNTPLFGWNYSYRLPADCLRVYRLNEAPSVRHPWQVEGRTLLADEPGPINVRYLRRAESEDDWPPYFVDAMVAELASRLALSIANTNAIAAAAATMARAKLADARWLDSQQSGKREAEPGPLERAHWRSSG